MSSMFKRISVMFLAFVMLLSSFGVNALASGVESPSGFKAENLGTMAIRLAWDHVPNADSYELKRDGKTVFSGNQLGFVDGGLTQGTTYKYSLFAKSGGEVSAEATLTHTLKRETVTKSPVNVKVVNLEKTRVTLIWDEVAGADYYNIRLEGQVVSSNYEHTRFTDTSLKADSSYTYSVSAVTNGAESDPAYVNIKTSVYEGETQFDKPTATTDGEVKFAFAEIQEAAYYTINRNPEWVYTPIGNNTYKVDYYNSKTGKRESWTAKSVNGKLPFNEENLANGTHTYQVDAYVRDNGGYALLTLPPVKVEVKKSGSETPTNPKPPVEGRPAIKEVVNGINVPNSCGVYKDMKTHWALNNVMDLSSKNVIKGHKDCTFKPGLAVTKGEFSAMVARIYDLEATTLSFNDTVRTFAYKEIEGLVGVGILVKSEHGVNFQPSKEITRMQAVRMLAKAYNLSSTEDYKLKGTAKTFTDAKNLNSADAYAVNMLMELGVVEGFKDNTLRANTTLTRSQSAAILSRFLALEVHSN